MKLDEARAVALMLTEGDVTAWIQMTIIENEYKVNFVMNNKLFEIDESTQEIHS